jgi:hypothetical protein
MSRTLAGGRVGGDVLTQPERMAARPQWTAALVLGEQDLVLLPGEAAEFDTRVPHWFGSVGAEPVEFLSLFGRQGERAHIRARPRANEHPG